MKIYICLGLATICDARPPRMGLQTRRAGLRSGSVVRPKFLGLTPLIIIIINLLNPSFYSF